MSKPEPWQAKFYMMLSDDEKRVNGFCSDCEGLVFEFDLSTAPEAVDYSPGLFAGALRHHLEEHCTGYVDAV